MQLLNMTRPFFTTDAAVSSHELSMPSISMSLPFSISVIHHIECIKEISNRVDILILVYAVFLKITGA